MRLLAARIGEERLFVGPAPTPAQRAFFESNGWQPPVLLAAGALFANVVSVVLLVAEALSFHRR